ncbi:MAG TPA: hypothetical protein VHB99_13465, partial [Pirellulales bacterium]|nr:hypothetical protein [Pirellulales bacterium]
MSFASSFGPIGRVLQWWSRSVVPSGRSIHNQTIAVPSFQPLPVRLESLTYEEQSVIVSLRRRAESLSHVIRHSRDCRTPDSRGDL